MDEQDDGIDFALAAYRDRGEWEVEDLAHDHLDDVETLADALRRLPGDGGAVALVAVDEEFFVIVRVEGPSTRVLLSDAAAADDWDLASSALDFLGLSDLDDDVPAGDVGLLADLGMDEGEMSDLLDDVDLYPDELLSDVAQLLGFGELFDDLVGLSPA